MLRFVPPKLLAKYAVFLDHGNGRGFFRTYDSIGPAKYAFRIHNGPHRWGRPGGTSYPGKILELVDGDWFTLYDVPKGIEHLPWEKDLGQNGNWYRSGWHTVPMSREEYGEWRARVERERLNIVVVNGPNTNTIGTTGGSNFATSQVH